MNKSPLRYPGGKTRACKIIDTELKKHIDLKKFTTLISPFFGGGSFEFYINSIYDMKVKANDKFKPLISFWKTVKSDKPSLITLIKELRTSFNKDQFIQYRKEIMQLPETEILKIAAHYFIINRSSFSGATLSGGYSKEAKEKRFTVNSIEAITNLNLDEFEFSNIDASDFITECDTIPNRLIFLDPPYYLEGKSTLYGYNGDMHESFDHSKLATTLLTINNWVMTYNDCEYIREKYKNYTIINLNWNYGMNKSKKSSEILIINLSESSV
jgi:DNA adenine methylase